VKKKYEKHPALIYTHNTTVLNSGQDATGTDWEAGTKLGRVGTTDKKVGLTDSEAGHGDENIRHDDAVSQHAARHDMWRERATAEARKRLTLERAGGDSASGSGAQRQEQSGTKRYDTKTGYDTHTPFAQPS